MASQGFGGQLDLLVERLKGIPESELERAGDVVGEIVEEAHTHQEAILRAATTRHGQRRMDRGQGNGPGRDDTGHMIDSITHGVTRKGNSIIGEWGWDEAEGYFLEQDGLMGPSRVPAAGSLHTSYIQAREKLWARIRGTI